MTQLRPRTFSSLLPVIAVLACLAGNALSQTPNRPGTPDQRMTRLFDRLALSRDDVGKLLRQAESIAQSFREFMQLKEYSSIRSGAPSGVQPDPAEYSSALIARWNAYTGVLRRELATLDGTLGEDRITLIYCFLRDEFWYEGFLTSETARARPFSGVSAPDPDSTRDAAYTGEERQRIAQSILNAEGKAERKDTLMPRIGEKEKESAQGSKPGTKKRRSPKSIAQETSDPSMREPPWTGMPSPPGRKRKSAASSRRATTAGSGTPLARAASPRRAPASGEEEAGG